MINQLHTIIDLKWLQDQGACSKGIEWLKENVISGQITVKELLDKLISTNEKEKLVWANWLITRKLKGTPELLDYAIFAAYEVLPIYEKEFPNCKIPRRSIEAAQAYRDNPCEGNRAMIHSAANAANTSAAEAYFTAQIAGYAAADAAAYAAGVAAKAAKAVCAAANAAYDAADYAANAADYAAAAAANAADYAADAAADYSETLIKIINFGVGLLEKANS